MTPTMEQPTNYDWFQVNDARFSHEASPTQKEVDSLKKKAAAGHRQSRHRLDGLARGAATIHARAVARKKGTGTPAQRAIGIMGIAVNNACPSRSRIFAVDETGNLQSPALPLDQSEYLQALSCATQAICPDCGSWIGGIHAGGLGQSVIEQDANVAAAMKPR